MVVPDASCSTLFASTSNNNTTYTAHTCGIKENYFDRPERTRSCKGGDTDDGQQSQRKKKESRESKREERESLGYEVLPLKYCPYLCSQCLPKGTRGREAQSVYSYLNTCPELPTIKRRLHTLQM